MVNFNHDKWRPLLDAEDGEQRNKEYRRNRMKAKRLTKDGAAYEAAIMVIKKHHPTRG